MGIKTKRTICIILSALIVGLLINLFTIPSEVWEIDEMPDYLFVVIEVIICISVSAFIVLLFVKKWRKQYLYIPLAIFLASIFFCAAFIPRLGINRNRYKQASRIAHQFADENNLTIVDIYQEPGDYSDFIATAKRNNTLQYPGYNEALEMDNDSVVLFIGIFGEWNQFVHISDTKNFDVVLPEKQILLLKKGGLKLTDRNINGHAKEYLDYLRTSFIDEYHPIKLKIVSYNDYNGANIRIHMSSNEVFKEPYLLFIFDKNLDKTSSIHLKNITITNNTWEKKFYFPEWKHTQQVRVIAIPSEVFNDEWFSERLLSNNSFWDTYQIPRYEHFLECYHRRNTLLTNIRGTEDEEEQKKDILGLYSLAPQYGILEYLKR